MSRSRAGSGPAASSEREAEGITRSGQAANARATSAGLAPCAPDAGGEEQPARAGQVQGGQRPVRADDGAHRTQSGGRQRGVQLPDFLEQAGLDSGAGRAARLLDRAALLVRGPRHDQDALSGRVRPGDEAAHGVQAQVRVHGDGIGFQRRARAQVRLGVGVVSRPDVAPLDVQDDEQARAAGLADQPGEGADPPPAVPLVERRLRLDQPDRGGRGGQREVSEPVQPVRGVAEPPLLQQRPRRVQAEGERAAGGAGSGEPGREGVSHAPSLASGSAGQRRRPGGRSGGRD